MFTFELSKLIEIAFLENPSALELLNLALAFAVIWGIFIVGGKSLIFPVIHNKPWLVKSIEREYHDSAKKLMKDSGFHMSKEDFITMKQESWPWLILVLVQHAVSGALCIPSVFGLVEDERLASGLVVLALTSEMGYEIEDVFYITYKRLFTKNGPAAVPLIILIIIGVHHSFASTLSVPTIMYYRSLKYVHSMCFDLQIVSAVCMGIQEYTKLLDISVPSQLFQFQALTAFGFVMAVWFRGIHWVYLVCQCIGVWYQDKAWGFVIVGAILSSLFTLFNVFLIIIPYYQRFMKFVVLAREMKQAKDEVSRRSSLVKLKEAAAELTSAVGANEQDFATTFAETTLVAGARQRRATMPATIRTTSSTKGDGAQGRSLRGSNGRRPSYLLMRSSLPPQFKSQIQSIQADELTR